MAKISLMKKLVKHQRQLLTLIAVFVAAIILGYLGESQAVHTSDLVTRQFLLQEMTRILARLQPVMKNSRESAIQVMLQTDFPDEIKKPISLGLAKNYPDGGWHLEDRLTRGEAVCYYSRLIDYVKQNLSFSQLTAEGMANFEDVNSSHWLADDLKILAGIGATMNFQGLRFFPEEILKISEAQAISLAIIDYFTANMLILSKGDTEIGIFAKGALKELHLHDFEVSWDGNSWYQMPVSGKIPIRESDQNLVSLFFRHPHFLAVGPVELPKIGMASAFVKLRREYAAFVKDNLEEFAKNTPIEDENELTRIKNRLQQLKEKHLSPQSFAAVVEEKPLYSGFAGPVEPEVLPEPIVREVVRKARKVEAPALKKAVDKITVKGRVIDAVNEKALEGALLVVNGENQKIGADGGFSFISTRHQVVEITVYCEGYSPLQMKHRSGYRSDSLDLRLKPELAIFNGRVICSESGLPVSEALVRLGDKATRSNADGSFQIRGIRPGYHQISCFARNFLEAHEIVFVDANQSSPYSLAIRKEFAAAAEPQPQISWDETTFAEDYSVDFAD